MIKKHPKQWNSLGSKTRYFIITGGRGSGKSFEVCRFTSLLSFEEGHRILFTRQTMTSAHLSIIPEFKQKIDLLEINNSFEVLKSEIINKNSGSEIIFRGIKTSSGDQTANLKSLQGITTWILDEAEELTDELQFDKINLSIRQKGKQNRFQIRSKISARQNIATRLTAGFGFIDDSALFLQGGFVFYPGCSNINFQNLSMRKRHLWEIPLQVLL